MGFIIILFTVGGIIFFLIHQRGNNLRAEWSQAAGRLGLNYSEGGLFNPHWIYGKKAGLRYDIKTFSRTTGGNANQKWTGYRVRFHRAADVRIRVTESARKQLTNRFQECEIDDEGIFCARPGVETSAPSIIDNVERLQSVTARLMAAVEEDKVKDQSAGPPPPAASIEPRTVSPGEEHQEPAAIPVAIPVETATPENPDSVIELDSVAVREPATEEIESSGDSEEGGESVIAAEIQGHPKPESSSTESSMTLTKISDDLFDSGRNRFQITQRFDAEYNGLPMLGEGKLVRAENYSNDRIFGRGPGTLAEVEIYRPNEPLPGHNSIRAVVQLPESASARSLRGNLGGAVTISGTMLRCDAFDGRIFLGTGEIA